MDPVLLLDHYRPNAEQWTDWQRVEAVLIGLDFTGVRRALLDRDYPTVRKDALLSALIRLGQHHSVDAKTAVVACLLPGLRRIVARYQDLLGRDDTWGELVTELWQQLTTYDLERRPRRIAANLLWDSASRLGRRVRAERIWRDHVDPSRCIDAGASGHDDGDLDVIGIAVVAGVLVPVDGALIAATRLGGLSLTDAAVLFAMSYEAARKRRQRAEAGWAAWWVPELSRESARRAASRRDREAA
jgi:hypothetical protein